MLLRDPHRLGGAMGPVCKWLLYRIYLCTQLVPYAYGTVFPCIPKFLMYLRAVLQKPWGVGVASIEPSQLRT